MSDPNAMHSSKIHDLYIELHGYAYSNGVPDTDSKTAADRIIGRTEIESHLTALLSQTKSNTGAYLVTGYRGMGKTSLVRKVVEKVKHKASSVKSFGRHPVIDVELSLAQDDLTENDILRMLASQIYRKYRRQTRVFGGGDRFQLLFLSIGFTLFVALSTTFLACTGAFDGIFHNTPETLFKYLPEFMKAPNSFLSTLAYIFTSTLLYFVLGTLKSILCFHLGITTHAEILSKLKRITERADSQLTIGHDLHIPNGSKRPWFSQKKAQAYPIASGKDIQNELRWVLELLDGMRFAIFKPRFIIVFDELDKIQPRYNVSNSGVDALGLENTFQANGLISASTRKRQEAIAQILANLKHFFNYAKAKFVLIAGREMFDASLADISDRDSFIGSIFDEVLYVPSFQKEKASNNAGGITGMTEQFVCSYLVQGDKGVHEHTLQAFFESIEDRESKPDEAMMALHVVQNFIGYLNYRSNGTPKKIIHLFEGFIIESSRRELKDRGVVISTKKGQGNPSAQSKFLRFKYLDQYRLSLVARLYRPYTLSNSRLLKTYSDKVLVSTAFLFDHITKFHNSAFSWGNIEHTPELLSVFKTPDIRVFFETMIEFMEKLYIRKTLSGIFQYKFRPRFRYEIIYLSKVNELESAAFNFTLDESLAIKRYYQAKLILTNSALSKSPDFDREKFIYASSMIHSILGDLHYYDQEYVDAVEHYGKSIQTLRDLPAKDLHSHQMFVLTVAQLKLGLAFERQKSFDFAFSHYNTVSDRVKSYFDHCTHRGANPVKTTPESTGSSSPLNNLFQVKSMAENLSVFHQPLVARLHLIEKEGDTGLSYRDVLASESVYDSISNSALLGEETEDYLNRSIYHLQVGLVLYFKSGKATLSDSSSELKYINEVIERIEGDQLAREKHPCGQMSIPSSALFEYLIAAFAIQLRAYNTVGDGVDGLKANELKKLTEGLKNNKEKKAPQAAASRDTEQKRTTAGVIANHIAYLLKREGYRRVNLTQLINETLQNFMSMISAYKCARLGTHWGVKYLETCAEIITRIGDVAVAFAGKELRVRFIDISSEEANTNRFCNNGIRIIDEARGVVSGRAEGSETKHTGNNSFFYCAIACYEVAALFYEQTHNSKQRAYSLRKIIALIHESLSFAKSMKCLDTSKTAAQTFTNKISDYLMDVMHRKLVALSAAGNAGIRLQVLKNQDLLQHLPQSDSLQNAIYMTTSMIENKESLITVSRILRLLGKFENGNDGSLNSFIKSTSAVSGMFERAQELFFKAQLNYDAAQKLDLWDALMHKSFTPAETPESTSGNANLAGNTAEEYEHLITDSIFALLETARIMRMFGKGFIIHYSALAIVYKYLGDWCVQYVQYRNKFPGRSEEVREQLDKLIADEHKHISDPSYFYESAILNYRKALDLHRGGSTYKSDIRDLLYLEDDLGDQLSHSMAALERFRINSGQIEQAITHLEQMLENDRFYCPKTYYTFLSASKSDQKNSTPPPGVEGVAESIQITIKKELL